MQLTKLTHACLVLEEQGQRLIIDPGVWTEDLKDFSDIVGVVITHAHADHFSAEHVAAILRANPTVKIYTTSEVVEQLQSPLAMQCRMVEKKVVDFSNCVFLAKIMRSYMIIFRRRKISVLWSTIIYTIPAIHLRSLAQR